MSLTERVQQDIVTAMKERSDLKLSTLRMMKTAIKNREIEVRHALSDEEVLKVLTTLIKQRNEAAEQFRAGGRDELAAKETAEITIIEAYMPAALSQSDIEATVRAAIVETGASGAKDMGTVMKAAMARFQAAQQRADGKSVSETVKRLLAGGA